VTAVDTWNAQAVAAIYEGHLRQQTAITAHLPRLRMLAASCDVCVEFGVKRGASSSALLLGAPYVRSYDLVRTSEADRLAAAAGAHWDYRIEDSRTAEIPPCDLLFVDSLHSYAQCDAELRRHADRVKHFLVFHDVGTFGEIAADGETGRPAWAYTPGGPSVPRAYLGIRPAIDEACIRDPSWQIAARYVDSHGLLVMERRR